MWSTLRSPMSDDEGEVTEVVGRSPPRTPAHAEGGGRVDPSNSDDMLDNLLADDTVQEDFVPDSLKSFFRQAKDTLIESQKGLFVAGSADLGGASSTSFDYDSPSHGTVKEDEEDVRLKGEILDRYAKNNQQEQPLSPEVFLSPPPNPVMQMTDSEIKRNVMDGMSPSPIMPPKELAPLPYSPPQESAPLPVSKPMEMKPPQAQALPPSPPPPPPRMTKVEAAPPVSELEPMVVSSSNAMESEPPGLTVETAVDLPRQLELLDDDDVLIDTLMQDGVEVVDLTNMPSDHYENNGMGAFGASAWDYGGEDEEEDVDISFVHEASEASYVGDIDETAMLTPMDTAPSPAPVPAPVPTLAPPPARAAPTLAPPPAPAPKPAATIAARPTSMKPPLAKSPPRPPGERSSLSRLLPPPPPPVPKPKRKPNRTSSALPRVAAIPVARRESPKAPAPPASRRPVATAPVSSRLLKGTSASAARRQAVIAPAPKSEPPKKVSPNKYAHVQSRLMESTAAREARLNRLSESTKPPSVTTKEVRVKPRDHSVPSRLLQGTSASQARVQSLSEPAKAPTISAADGRAKARERVRQKLLAQKKEKEAQASAETQPTKVSPAEGVARARERIRQRERMRQRQLQQRGAEKENRKSNTAVSNGPRKLTVPKAPSFATTSKYGEVVRSKDVSPLSHGGDAFFKGLRDDRSVPSSAPRTSLTVPHAPKFASSARPREEVVRDRSADVTLAQSSDFLAKGLRHERPTYTPAARRTTLTIPQAPKFATSARHVEKPPRRDLKVHVSMAQGSDAFSRGLRDDHSVSSMSRASSGHKGLTTPRGPHFVTSDRHGDKVVTPRAGGDDLSLAQSTRILMSELRKPTPTMNRSGPTLPVSPQFQPIMKRQLPQSTEEKEKEMMEFYKSHPFKATPNMMNAKPRPVAKKPSNKQLTVPTPFRLATEEKKHTVRGKQSRVPPKVTSISPKEAADLEEMKKQFHARPVPKFTQTTNIEAKKKSPPKITAPKPFNFATERLTSKHRKEGTSPESKTSTPKFHARPVPDFSKPALPAKVTPKSQVTKPIPFQFASENLKSEYRREATCPDDAELTKQFKAMAIPDFTVTPAPKRSPLNSVTKPKPFDLASSHLKSEHRPAVTSPDDLELLRQFKARPLPKSTFRSPPGGSPIKSSPNGPKTPSSDMSQKRLAAAEASRRRAEAAASAAKVQQEKGQKSSPAAQTPRSAEKVTSAERRRAKHAQLEAEQQRQASVDRMRQVFRAKPVPKSTYRSPPTMPRTPARKSPASGGPVEYVVFS